jgi:hypothetical protein
MQTIQKLNFSEAKVRFTSVPVSRVQEHVSDFIKISIEQGASISDKGLVGDALENFLGLDPSARLCDLSDGEIKSCQEKGHFNLTSVPHTLDDVFSGVAFEDSKVFTKIRKVILWVVDKQKNLLDICYVNLDEDYEMFSKLKQDYIALSEYLVECYTRGEKVSSSFKGPNKYLVLGSSGRGELVYRGRVLSSPNSRAWTVSSKFVRQLRQS